MVSGAHRCRGCGGGPVEPVVDLGPQPAADHFPPESDRGVDPRWPLELWFCTACTLVQLGPVDPALPEAPLAVESATSRAHAVSCVDAIVAEHPELVGAPVIEFASHHGGSWLPGLSAAGCRPAGPQEPGRLVVDVHGLAHDPDPGAGLAERARRLAPDGLMILEFHHLLPLVTGNQFDTIRHGHWTYLSLGAVERLTGPLGLQVVSARTVPVFGGSLQVHLRHAGAAARPDGSVGGMRAAERAAGLDEPARLAALQGTAHRCARDLHERLTRLAADGRAVLGYGAPSKAPVLLDLSGVGPDLLPFTVDIASGKHGRRIPGSGIPIRPVAELRAARPDVVLVLTWDIADEVIGQLESGGGWGAQYLVPLPTPHVVGGSAA